MIKRSVCAKRPSGRGWTIEFAHDILIETVKILVRISHEKDEYEAV